MTGPAQIGINATAIRNLANRLERMGYSGGDAHAEAEHIALNLAADGWRPVDKPVPQRGPGASRRSIDAAKSATEAAVRAARDRRKQPAGQPAERSATDG